jgi:uncharacterized BrkB/YihY/UPF0761 family membrane protein
MNFYGVSDETRVLMEHVLAQYFLPAHSRDIVELMFKAADSVTQNIGLVGLLSFCVTLFLLARELEGHVLKICNKTTSLGSSIVRCAAFLFLAPSSMLVPILIIKPFLPFLQQMPGVLARLDYPFVLCALVLIGALRAFSAGSLGWRASTAGAASAALAAWGAWQGCLIYFNHSAALSAYGALACFAEFLLWVFVAWCCVLFGVKVAAKTQCVVDAADETHV